MFRLLRLLPIVAALIGAVLLPGTASAGTDTYNDYSMMFSRHAAQFTPDDVNRYQWAWNPQSASESWISWGEASQWPPKTDERFRRVGDWVILTGYGDGKGGLNQQRVTQEYIGDAQCRNMRPLPSDNGLQHYVRWNIQSSAYCLRATGTIMVAANGAIVHFQHNQIWYPPAPCSNRYYGSQTCIRQHEQWFDDNGHPLQRTLERDQYIAKGLGTAFRIDQSYDLSWPQGMKSWQADMKYSWSWS